MNRRADASKFVAKARAAAARALDDAGGEAADRVRESLSTPHPPASGPGEPPHLRTGNLHAGVGHSTTEGRGVVSTTVTSARVGDDPRVPFWLENGTERMAARPYMGPARDAAGPRAHAALANALKSVKP